MFEDIFGPSIQQFQDSHVHHATNYLALALLLIEKGIITDDDLDRARTQATHIIDQVVAQKQEEAQKEFDAEHPGVREMFGKIFGTRNAI